LITEYREEKEAARRRQEEAAEDLRARSAKEALAQARAIPHRHRQRIVLLLPPADHTRRRRSII